MLSCTTASGGCAWGQAPCCGGLCSCPCSAVPPPRNTSQLCVSSGDPPTSSSTSRSLVLGIPINPGVSAQAGAAAEAPVGRLAPSPASAGTVRALGLSCMPTARGCLLPALLLPHGSN